MKFNLKTIKNSETYFELRANIGRFEAELRDEQTEAFEKMELSVRSNIKDHYYWRGYFDRGRKILGESHK